MAVRVTQIVPQVGHDGSAGLQNARVSQLVTEVGEGSSNIQYVNVSQFVVEIGMPVVEPAPTFVPAGINMPLIF
jgi:hypothetical protein